MRNNEAKAIGKHPRWRIVAGLFLFALVSMMGCSREEEQVQVIREQCAAWTEMADILESVKDEQSMAQARIALNELKVRMEQIARKAKALPPASRDVEERSQTDRFLLQKAFDRCRAAIGRIKDLPGGRAFLDEFPADAPSLSKAVQP